MARPDLFSHRKFRKLARLLRSEALAVGHLELLWHAAYTDGEPRLGESPEVESAARWTGKEGRLTAALLDSGFIEQLPDGTYGVHDLISNAPAYVRKRQLRHRLKRERDQSVTSQRLDTDSTLDSTSSSSPSSQVPKEQEPSKKPSRVARAVVVPPGFARFWAAYPDRNGIKVGKQAALKHWNAGGCEPRADKIIDRLENQKLHHAACIAAQVFIADFPDPERWIKHKRYNDEVRPLVMGVPDHA